MPFFGSEGSPTKIHYGKKGTLSLTSLLEDLEYDSRLEVCFAFCRGVFPPAGVADEELRV